MTHSTRTIAVFSGKGGVGKTFVSLHLAYGLSEVGNRTLLVDFDLHGGAVLAEALGVRPLFSLLDAERVAPKLVPVSISPSLSLVSSPTRLEDALVAQRSDLSHLLTAVFNGFDWVVIDLSHRLDLATTSALSVSHWVWVVTTGDPLSLHATDVALGRLSALGLNRRRIRLMMNGTWNHGTIPWKGLHSYVIPHDRFEEGVSPTNGVYSQVCAHRLRWFALEEAQWVGTRKDPPRAPSSAKGTARDRSCAPA